jgi:hypothetical protein
MLGCHPELYGFPELKLFAHDTVGDVLDEPPRLPSRVSSDTPWDPAPGLRRAVAQVLLGSQDADTLDSARQWLEERRRWPTRRLVELLLQSVAPLVGVEKSPETSFDEAGPARVLDWYPTARFIHLVRHPVAYQRSLQRMLLLYDRPDACAASWLSTHRRIDAFCAALPTEQVLLVRVEEALAASEAIMAAIARFLGIGDDPPALDQMRHPERSEYVVGAGAGLPGHWDPGFLSRPALRPAAVPDTVRAPPEWALPASLEDQIVELAGSFGYV